MEEIKQKVKKVLKRSKEGMTLNQILKRAGFRKRERKKALGVIYKMEAVSYTHLTLPTILLV